MAEKTTEETVAEVQQLFDAEAKGGEPVVTPEYTPPEAATPAETKGDEKAVTPESKETPQILGGKYKTTEELATAYQELEKTYHASAAKVTEQEGALGAAAKDREVHQKFLDAVGKAEPENVQAAILQYQKETGRVAFDGEVIDPKLAVHLANVLNPVVQKLEDGLAQLKAGKNAEVNAEAEAKYEEEYPFMANPDVKDTINKVAEKLRAESPDGQLDGDRLIAETAKIVRAATLKEAAAKAALETRTGADAPASPERASEPKPKETKEEHLVDSIFGNSEKGIGAGGEIPPDLIP